MQCPVCRTSPLQPTKLEDGLLAQGCAQCAGALVALLYYRDWAERQPPSEEAPVQQASEAPGETSHALSCPKCARLMSKFQISGTRGNRLDLCASCDEAWLDGGEWQLLKALELSHKMPAIFTDAWQRQVRQQASAEARRQRFSRLAGAEAISRADEIRDWLKDHPQRRELLFYIGHE